MHKMHYLNTKFKVFLAFKQMKVNVFLQEQQKHNEVVFNTMTS